MNKIEVFISSVQREFAPEREALYHYMLSDPLLGVFFQPFVFEKLPAVDKKVQAAYLSEVKKSEIYIALLGKEYGAEDKQGLSATEKEYNQATKLHKYRLVFLKQTERRHPKTEQLIDRIGLSVVRKSFQTQAELMAGVYASLVHYLVEKGHIQSGPFDASTCRNAGLTDIDTGKVKQFVSRARAARNFPLPATAPVPEVLQHLNLLSGEHLTNAAILLFGRNPRQFFLNAEVKCASFHGLEVTKPIPSYQVYKGDVFEMVDQAVDFVLSKLNVRVGSREKSNRASVQYEIPRAVVAEAIVNAVAHRDYASHATVQVMLFDDRLEVWNPGGLPPSLTIEQLRGPHGSVPHNPLLAEAMYLAQYIEKLGSGTRDMIRLSREVGLREPDFELQDGFKTTVWRPAIPQTPDIGRRSTAGAPQKYRRSTVGVPQKYRRSTVEVEHLVLALEGELKRQEIQKLLELKHEGNFRDNYLLPALKLGFIEMTDPEKPNNPKQKYRLTNKGKELKKKIRP